MSGMSGRYDLKRDSAGWTVFDRWTGRAVVLGLVPQIGLAFGNAEERVRELNRRGDPEDRRILQ